MASLPLTEEQKLKNRIVDAVNTLNQLSDEARRADMIVEFAIQESQTLSMVKPRHTLLVAVTKPV